MRRLLLSSFAGVCAVVLLTGCQSVMSPALGILYTEVDAPLAVGDGTGSSKVGTSECNTILCLIATGDASIETACKSAGIKKIHHVDYHSKNLLGIMGKFTCTVYGE